MATLPDVGLCPAAPRGGHPVGQQEIHEYEASGGGSGRRRCCRLTSFSRSLQINLRINLDGTDGTNSGRICGYISVFPHLSATVQGAIDRSVTEDNIGLRPQFFLRRSYRYCATDGRYFRCPLFPRCSSRLIVDGDRPNSLAMVRILFP